MKIDGRKVNGACVFSIITNITLTYFGIMPLWVCVVVCEAWAIVMAFRSTARKIEGRLDEVKNREFTVMPDRGVHRFVK